MHTVMSAHYDLRLDFPEFACRIRLLLVVLQENGVNGCDLTAPSDGGLERRFLSGRSFSGASFSNEILDFGYAGLIISDC
jgi:hypothetical protein